MNVETFQLAPGSYIDLIRGFLPGLYPKLTAAIDWKIRHIKMYGKTVAQPRLVAWYGTQPYTYSGTKNEAQVMPNVLGELLPQVVKAVQGSFNSVLCNHYRDGRDSIGMHSDNEPEMGPSPTIASLSSGATRRFVVKPRCQGETLRLDLMDGDLLVMRGDLQKTHLHGVPKQPKVTVGRVNLTFRNVLEL